MRGVPGDPIFVPECNVSGGLSGLAALCVLQSHRKGHSETTAGCRACGHFSLFLLATLKRLAHVYFLGVANRTFSSASGPPPPRSPRHTEQGPLGEAQVEVGGPGLVGVPGALSAWRAGKHLWARHARTSCRLSRHWGQVTSRALWTDSGPDRTKASQERRWKGVRGRAAGRARGAGRVSAVCGVGGQGAQGAPGAEARQGSGPGTRSPRQHPPPTHSHAATLSLGSPPVVLARPLSESLDLGGLDVV